MDQKLAEYKSLALSSLSAARQNLESSFRPKEARRPQLEKRRSTEESKHSTSHKREFSHHRRSSSGHVVKGETIAAPTPAVDPKPIRQNAIKNMVEALKKRAQASADVQPMEEEKLRSLVKDIEDQLFRLYNKDVGPKYKNKYRSLMFNIKDEKNSGLFRKILDGKISPKELVAMSAEEMANKELKQWRQAELKHDIEMIKSTELEELARGTKFMVKSHKGEEIIGDQAKKTNVTEVKLPEELAVSETTVKEEKPKKEEGDEKNRKLNDDRRRRKDKERRKDHHRSSRHHHHSTSHRHSSSSSTSSSSKHRHHHSSSKEGDRHKRHRHSSKDGHGRHHSKETSGKEEGKKDQQEVKEKMEKDLEKKRVEEKEEAEKTKDFSEKLAKAEKVLSEFKKFQEEGGNSSLDMDRSEVSPGNEGSLEKEEEENRPLSPRTPTQEVTSTVTIKSPETEYEKQGNPTVWKGDIDMPDVAQFSVTAQSVSGTTDYLTLDLRDVLKIVGRIPPKTVWEYVEALNDAQTKEILLVRLLPASDDEKERYEAFFAYLQKRGRFAVVGNNSSMVKDCYIFPLASEEQVHESLLPFEGPGLEEERPNMLLSLVVRSKRKRPGLKKENQLITLKKSKKEKSPQVAEEDEYDPAMAGGDIDLGESPGASPNDDDDDVYDPESAFDDEEGGGPPSAKMKKTSPSPSMDSPKPLTSTSGGFTEQLAKLTKEVEQRKAELASIRKEEDAPAKDQAAAASVDKAVKGFQGLPKGIASILFGGEGSSSGSMSQQQNPKGSLSSMSDADLLAKAQEMEATETEAFQPQQAAPLMPGGEAPSYSDPNWMNTGPPPPPPVPMQFPHMVPGGPPPQGPPWMRGPPPPQHWQQQYPGGSQQGWGQDEEGWRHGDDDRGPWRGGGGGDYDRRGDGGGGGYHHHHHRADGGQHRYYRERRDWRGGRRGGTPTYE